MMIFFFFSSRRRHTRWTGDWSSDVCSSDLHAGGFRADSVARAMVLEPHEVHCQESQALLGGYRPALCVAEHPFGGSSPSSPWGRRHLGNIHLCPTATARAPRRTHG